MSNIKQTSNAFILKLTKDQAYCDMRLELESIAANHGLKKDWIKFEAFGGLPLPTNEMLPVIYDRYNDVRLLLGKYLEDFKKVHLCQAASILGWNIVIR